MKICWKRLIWCLAIPLAVGLTAGLITRGDTNIYETVVRPALAPPPAVFPIVWSILYILMGISLYLVESSHVSCEKKVKARWVFAAQLIVNFFWPILFFTFRAFLLSFFWLVLLWLLVLAMILIFVRISRPAGLLQIPYLLWVTFAGYLNLSIYLLNR